MLFDTDDNYVVLEMTGPDGKERRYDCLLYTSRCV